MTEFAIHTEESAPDDAKPLLQASKKAYGMIPNLHGVFAESPQILEAYQTLQALFSKSSLSTTERHVVWLTINVYHGCHYCVPAHTFLALMDKVPEDLVDAIREERPIPDTRLEALRQFTLALTAQRGAVDDDQVEAFFEAGFTKRNIFDVLLGLSHKVLSNYANHLAQTPIDGPFAKYAWQKRDDAGVRAAE